MGLLQSTHRSSGQVGSASELKSPHSMLTTMSPVRPLNPGGSLVMRLTCSTYAQLVPARGVGGGWRAASHRRRLQQGGGARLASLTAAGQAAPSITAARCTFVAAAPRTRAKDDAQLRGGLAVAAGHLRVAWVTVT